MRAGPAGRQARTGPRRGYFFFFGMYRERYADSRFDEIASLAKVVTVGVLILVFAIWIDTLTPGATRSIIFLYWAALFSLVTAGKDAGRICGGSD